ncbi:MAG: DUF5723 family protein [Bacteroidales bacterium]
MRLFTALFIFIVLSPYSSFTQEMWGLTSSNNSGSHALMLNPASLSNSRQYLEVNLVSAGLSLNNNYLYLKKDEYTFPDLFRKEFQSVDYNMSPDKITIYDSYTKEIKQLYLNSRITGPSVILSWQRHSFGFTNSFRMVLSAHNFPYHTAKFSYEGVDFQPQQNIDYHAENFQFTHLSWAETAFTYAYRLYYKGMHYAALGITAKRLMGTTGLFIDGRSADYMAPDDSTLLVYNIDADVGISVPLDRDNNRLTLANNFFRGKGWGFDIGFIYQRNSKYKFVRKSDLHTSLCGQSFADYDYKIGLSLLGFGSINFTEQTDLWSFDNVGTFWPGIDRTNYKTIADAAGDLGYRFYNDSAAALTSDHFRIFLPTALSLQFDYHIISGLYVNSIFIHSVMGKMPWVYRPAQAAVIPRFESRYFDVSVPLSLYDLRYPRIGVSLRLLFLTIGTDRLASYMGWEDFTGLDAYFSIKIPFNKGSCVARKKKGRHTHCNEFEIKGYKKKSEVEFPGKKYL